MSYDVEARLRVTGAAQWASAFEGAAQSANKLSGVSGKMNSLASTMGSVGSKLTNSITKPALIATTAAVGMVGALGLGRLRGLDNAKAKLKGLGYNVEEIGEITDITTDAIQGGMTTMAEGVDIAAGALAAGVKPGKDLGKYIQLVGDAAIASNRPVDEMAQIFNRVQGGGRLMTRELNMIEHAMPGFSKAMMEHIGEDSMDAFREMVTAGEIGSDDFLAVMDDFAGGMAKAHSETFDGMVKNVKNYIAMIGESLGEGIFDRMKDGLHELEDYLSSDEVQAWAVRTGEAIADMAETVIDKVKQIKEWWDGLSPTMQGAISKFIMWGAVALAALGPIMQFISPILVGFNVMFGWIGAIAAAFGGWGAIFSAVGTVIGAVFAFITSTLGIVVIAIAAAAALIYVYWEPISEFFISLWEGIKEVSLAVWEGIKEAWSAAVEFFLAIWEGVSEFFSGLWEGITEIFLAVWEPIQAAWSSIVEFLKEVWSGVSEFFSMIWDEIVEVFLMVWEPIKAAWDEVVATLKEIWTPVAAFFSDMWADIVEIFTLVWEIIVAVFEVAWTVISTVVTVGIEVVKTIIETVFNAIVDFFQVSWEVIKAIFTAVWSVIGPTVTAGMNVVMTVITTVMNVIKTVVTAVWNVIKAVFTTTLNVIKAIVTTAWNAIKVVIQTTMNVISTVISTVWNVIKGVITTVMSVIGNVISTAWNVISTVIKTVLSVIKAVVTGDFGSIKGIISDAVSSIKNTISKGFNALKGIVSKAFNAVKDAIKDGMQKGLDIVINIKDKFKTAGLNMVKAIGQGIKDGAQWVKDKLSDLVGSLRDMLPFSNAKDGPLSDIMDINFGGSIGSAIKGGQREAENAMNRLAQGVHNQLPNADMGSRVNSINRQAKRDLTQSLNSNISVGKQAAVINVNVGSKRIASEVVDDITKLQNLSAHSRYKSQRRGV